MISKKMTEKLNYQLNREIFSAYLYVSMAAYAMSEGFAGTANWFNIQVQEELVHAQKFYNYINGQGERVILAAIEAPEIDFNSLKDLFEKTLKHEKEVTALINGLVALARKENDYATDAFLQWFVTEQVEEELNPTEILQKLKIAGNDGNALFMIDKDLGQRVFVAPTQV